MLTIMTIMLMISGTWRSRVEKIFFFKASMAKTQIPTGELHSINLVGLSTMIFKTFSFENNSIIISGKNPPAPSCENPSHSPSQFSFQISKRFVNICEISLSMLINLGKFAQIFLEMLEALTIPQSFQTEQATPKDVFQKKRQNLFLC